ncbi:hypothetical protein SLEP1_g22450 [Rubroshorea leprosula]|uniref:Uncharacterized protein n=1 Tax=Rubroshorea leprosula TaxID=152421 RepID=A0AAV5JI22_9ROSI|nr:hypothetical protein SLEP1_g22450 [Rubroshorea leprosula]
MERNPSKFAVMAPVARDIAEMGVDPIVRAFLLSNPSVLTFSIFLASLWSAASKNNTTFITSILLSPASPNAPLIPTAEIVKGGEKGNAARNATIASMRRKPRSSKDWATFEDVGNSVIAIHSWSSFVNAEVLKVYDDGFHYPSVFRNSLVLWILAACMLRLILFRYEGRAKV